MWRWNNYLVSQVPAGKTPLLINIDETAICRFQGHGKGTVFVRKAVQKVSLAKRREYMNHVGVVCDQPLLQRLLPQYIIGTERTLPARAMARLNAARPGYVRLRRRKSMWMNQELFARIIRDIMDVLQPYLDEYQVILIFDAFKAHLGSCVFTTCASVGAWPAVVPPLMTWLLQMLDSHTFRPYKACLQGEYSDARAGGPVNIDRFLQCIYTAMEETMQSKSWQSAFQQNGFGVGQASLSNTVRRHLQLEGEPIAIPAGRPSLEDVQLCFIKKLVVPASVFSRMAEPAPAPAAPAAGHAPPPPPAAERAVTRSMSAAARAVPPPAPPVVVAHRLLPRRYIPPSVRWAWLNINSNNKKNSNTKKQLLLRIIKQSTADLA